MAAISKIIGLLLLQGLASTPPTPGPLVAFQGAAANRYTYKDFIYAQGSCLARLPRLHLHTHTHRHTIDIVVNVDVSADAWGALEGRGALEGSGHSC